MNLDSNVIDNKDSLMMSLYKYDSEEFRFMYSYFLDTCKAKYGCNQIDYMKFGISPRTDSVEYNLSSRNFVYPKFLRNFAVFKVDETFVIVNEELIESLPIFSSAKFLNKVNLNELVSPPFNECLRSNNENNHNTIFVSFSFIKSKQGKLDLINFTELIGQ